MDLEPPAGNGGRNVCSGLKLYMPRRLTRKIFRAIEAAEVVARVVAAVEEAARGANQLCATSTLSLDQQLTSVKTPLSVSGRETCRPRDGGGHRF